MIAHVGGEAELDQQLVRVVDTLTEKFTGRHDRDAVTAAVAAARAELTAGARVTTYLPVLVSRRAADRLAGRSVS